MSINEVNGAGNSNNHGYTKVTVKDKDSGQSFVIDFKNAKIKGNEAEWTVKDGKVYGKDGKEIQGNELEVTKYQAALIKAAAGGDGDGKRLDTKDLVGGMYGELAEEELQKAKSEYHVAKETYNNPSTSMGYDADALEHGKIYANVENAKGEKGHLEIQFMNDEQAQAKTQEKAWYEFWK